TLGKSVLPRSMLQIHYRSKYRELIAFSNAAYYGSKLSIPVRHPDAVIQENRPIEMIRVDGVYANQTNRKEAERVVDFLAEQWATSDRPTIGVVTFNAKQADLIEDLLAERADQDVFFRQALGKEQERQENGEDMGFFVKNVENVQGDERDIIIFSSTFGKNEEGAFKRQFGLLGQAGGERRLNVAITRAKEKIILITSLPIKDISDNYAKNQSLNGPRDYLQAYFDYAAKLSDGTLDAARQALDNMSFKNVACDCPNFEKDGFIRSVASFIKSLGLKPSAIQDSDAFGLDFVIEDQQKRCYGIGIECDAHCHPILDNARAREVWRPKVLRMGIPHVYRVTSYAWYHRREEEMERLKQALEEALGVTLRKVCLQVVQEGEVYERS
ncbi:MAG: histidine kinase, partial [Verrucomicrobia bacterium]|nr:histidine kinase [Verrucomicrobiota bacterium]